MPQPARLLDLTRLVSRLGKGPLTGVDRVELAWAEHLLQGDAMGIPLFALVRLRAGFALLGSGGVAAIVAQAQGRSALPEADLLARLMRRDDPARARAETLLRGHAIARCLPFGLASMLARYLPPGTAYFNMGHANLAPRVFAAQRGPRLVLLHDTIPIDFPEFTRPDIPAVFARKLAAISAGADLVIHSTDAARAASERHLMRAGRVPPGIVAPLGVVVAAPGAFHLPGLDPSRPWFVTIGTIEPRKNHALLLDVWQGLAARLPADAMPQLVIAGSRGWSNAAVFARLDTRPPHVIEAPGLGDSALSGLQAGSQGLLFPSFAEGYGLPPAEAAALGVPVFASPLAAVREVLGDYPVYLDNTDSYSWMETIERVVTAGRPTDRQCFAVRGGRRPWVPPTWDSHFNTVLKAV